jgi:hypothetical protein
MWKKVVIDLVSMPVINNYRYFVLLRDNLSRWVEAKLLITKKVKGVVKFL